MRGELHLRLWALLNDAWRIKGVTQESLGAAIGQSQENAGLYLRGGTDKDGKVAGTLDLDEAAAALHHIGSSLEDFLAGAPARKLSREERLVRALELRPELTDLAEDLLDVPRTQLPGVIDLIRNYARLARRTKRTAGPIGGNTPAGNTRPGRGRRR